MTVELAERRVVPYVSFTALVKLLRRIEDEGGPPDRIDRTYLRGMSGGYQAQILASLRSLGLIDSEGTPTPQLITVARSVDSEAKVFFQQAVQILYPEAVDLAKRRGSAGQLHEIFKEQYGVSGSTLEGAIRFYLDASAYADVPVSPNFRPPPRARAKKGVPMAAAKKRSSPTGTSAKTEGPGPSVSAVPTSTQRVDLLSGGNVIVTLAADVFKLSEPDRAFVFDIVDKMKAYQSVIYAPEDSEDSTSESTTQGDNAG